MLNQLDHGGVTEVVLSTRYSRAIRLQVSAFLHRGFMIDAGFVITHFHEDHAGNLGLITSRGIPATVSAETLRRHRELVRVPLYRWALWGQPHLSGRDPEPADHPFELIPTPGHSRDHVAVYDADGGIVFTGDLFLGVKAAVAHADESPSEMVASLRTILALRPTAVFDSHRGLLRDPIGALNAKADWLETTIAAIRAANRAGTPDSVIVRELLGGEDRVAVVSFGQISKRNFVRAAIFPL